MRLTASIHRSLVRVPWRLRFRHWRMRRKMTAQQREMMDLASERMDNVFLLGSRSRRKVTSDTGLHSRQNDLGGDG